MDNNLWAYLDVLKRRFWVILLLLVVTMAVVLGRAATTPPAYRSSTSLQVNLLEPEEVTLYTRLNTESSSDAIELVLFQFETLVRSSRIAERTLAATGIDVSSAELVSGIKVERDPAGDVITVSATATSPENAEKLLQTQVDLALQDFRESRARPSEASGKFLETELVQAEKELEAARAAVLRFKLDNRVESLDRELAAEEQAIRDLGTAQQTAEIEIKRLEAVIGALAKQLEDAQTAAGAAQADSPAAESWNQVALDLQQQIANRRVDVASQQAQADAVVSLLAKRQANLATLITLGGQYATLQDTAKASQDTRDFLGAKMREAKLKESQSRSIGYLQIVRAPSTPRTQLPTQTVRTAILGAILSLVAGAVLVFVLELIERSLRHSSRATSGEGRNQA